MRLQTNKILGVLGATAALFFMANVHSAHAVGCATSGTDVTIAATCDLAAGSYTFSGTLTINTGVIVNALGNTTNNTGVTITSDNIVVTGSISADGRGYAYGGAGKGTASSYSASYGGKGGVSSNGVVQSGPVYGSVTQPTDLGSGNASYTAGGAIHLIANNTLTINGSVTANGTNSAYWAGPSGGSIWLQTSTLAGNGTISAIGSPDNYAQAGGGGRIAIYYTTDSSTLISGNKITARGGSGAYGVNSGAAGTVYLKSAAQQNGTLLIDNNAVYATTTPVTSANETYDTIRVSRAANYGIPSGTTVTATTFSNGGLAKGYLTVGGTLILPSTFTLNGVDLSLFSAGTISGLTSFSITNAIVTDSGGTYGSGLSSLTIGSSGQYVQAHLNPFSVTSLTVQNGGILTHLANGSTKAYIVNISATNVDIQSGGQVNVVAKGFTNQTGPGAGTGNPGAAGGYGGAGGTYSTFPGGQPYGSQTDPSDLGSGGGYNPGGGMVKIVASNSLAVNGNIYADGGNSNYYGGGSGGTVNLSAGVLTGSGNITAKGPNCGGGYGGGPGGGRIAIVASSNQSSLTVGTKVLATGGAGLSGANGSAGTIYFPTPNPVPTITSLSPTSTSAGGQSFTLTVNGTGFVASSVVQWNQAALSTTYITTTQMTAVVPQANIAQAGTAYITVYSPSPGGGTTQPTSFPIIAVPPVVVNTAVSSITSGGSQSSSLALAAGTTVNVYVHGSVTAQNGCASLSNVSVTLYLTSAGANCSPDGNTCASASTASFTNCQNQTANYEVAVPMQYYAEPTDSGSTHYGEKWYAAVTITDSQNNQGTTTGSPFDVLSLLAFSTSPTLDYGTMTLGALSSKQSVTIENLGNRLLKATAVSNGPMACQIGSIPSTNTHASLNANEQYAQMTAVPSDNPVTLMLGLAKRTTAGNPTVPVYFQTQVPYGLYGLCSNVLTFTALAQ